jgi:hypothetical protein
MAGPDAGAAAVVSAAGVASFLAQAGSRSRESSRAAGDFMTSSRRRRKVFDRVRI